MANTIQIKRTSTQGVIPTTAQVSLGELALNTYDGKLFFKKNVTGTETVLEVVTTTDTQTLSNKTLTAPALTGVIEHIGTSFTSRAAATQDGVQLLGRAGGTSSFDVILTPTTLTADRTLTLPDATTTLVGTDVSQNLTNKILTTRAGTATAGTAPIKLTSGTNLTTAEAGAIEYDGTYLYSTETTTSGRGHVPSKQTFRLTSDAVSTISTGLFFGTTSAINLAATSVYEIVFFAVATKNTAGTITWQITTSSAPTRISAQYVSSAITGITGTGAPPTGTAGASAATTATFVATGSITNNAVITYRFTVHVLTNAATTLNLNISAMSAGTVLPLAGSYYTVERISTTTGSFA